MNRPVFFALSILTLFSLLLSACQPVSAGTSSPSETPAAAATSTPLPANTAPPQTTPTAPEETPGPLRVWLSPELPGGFSETLQLPNGLVQTGDQQQADLLVQAGGESNSEFAQTHWVYALVAPFPTVTDAVASEDLRLAWQGKAPGALKDDKLLVSPETRAVLTAWWGAPGGDNLQVAPEDTLLDSAWQQGAGKTWAIVPFEAIQPRWKVLRLDNLSPMDKDFDVQSYALSAPIQATWTGAAQPSPASALELELPTNRDPQKLTVLALTGTTALSRQTAETMNEKGVTYPGQDIQGWLAEADLVHISNEVSFYADCPKAGPDRRDMRFCSPPNYIELLEAIGANLIELTGNHILDWGYRPFLDTLAMYREQGWQIYGGGENLSAAEQTLEIENHGNRLAFIGCSPAGPADVWATKDTPGSAPCDWAELETRIADLRQQGWLPVVTLQAVETDGYQPAIAQGMPDFRRLARAGAVIVSGSQSHWPQTMTFVGDNFVHYGLGNLFFDQMDQLPTRQGFIDRHVFYNGRYLGVELLTTMIEDYARPRSMTPDERSAFLDMIFSLSLWNGE